MKKQLWCPYHQTEPFGMKCNSTHVIHELRYKEQRGCNVLNEGKFRVITMENVKAFHVMYVLRTYKVIHSFWFLFFFLV